MMSRKCDVCRWEIKDTGKQIEYEGRIILVCCDECERKVRANPRKYAGRRKAAVK